MIRLKNRTKKMTLKSRRRKEEEEPEETVDYGGHRGLELPLVDEPVTITWMVVSSLTD